MRYERIEGVTVLGGYEKDWVGLCRGNPAVAKEFLAKAKAIVKDAEKTLKNETAKEKV